VKTSNVFYDGGGVINRREKEWTNLG